MSDKIKRFSLGTLLDDMIRLQGQYPQNGLTFTFIVTFPKLAFGYMSDPPYIATHSFDPMDLSTKTSFTNQIVIDIDKPKLHFQFDLSSGNYQAIADSIATLLESYSLS